MTDKKILTIKEVASATGLSVYRVRQYVKDGTFPSMSVTNSPNAKVLMNIDIIRAILDGLLGVNDSTDYSPRIVDTNLTSKPFHIPYAAALLLRKPIPGHAKATYWN